MSSESVSTVNVTVSVLAKLIFAGAEIIPFKSQNLLFARGEGLRQGQAMSIMAVYDSSGQLLSISCKMDTRSLPSTQSTIP